MLFFIFYFILFYLFHYFFIIIILFYYYYFPPVTIDGIPALFDRLADGVNKETGEKIISRQHFETKFVVLAKKVWSKLHPMVSWCIVVSEYAQESIWSSYLYYECFLFGRRYLGSVFTLSLMCSTEDSSILLVFSWLSPYLPKVCFSILSVYSYLCSPY